MIVNTPFNVSVAIGTSLTEVLNVQQPKESVTANIRVITTDLAANISVQLALVPSGMALTNSLNPEYYLQPKDIVLGPNGITDGFLEDTAVIIPAGMKLVAKASAGGLVCRAHGLTREVQLAP